MEDFTIIVLCWALFIFTWLIHAARHRFRLNYDNSFAEVIWSIPAFSLLIVITAEYIHRA